MKKIKYILVIYVIVFVSCGKKTVNPNQDNKEHADFYVAPNSMGRGDGLNVDNASDFLSDEFWLKVQKILTTKEVKVQFVGGNYSRAYTEKPLVFNKFGHESHRLILKGNKDVVFSLPPSVRRKTDLIAFTGAQNITIDNFHFTGNGHIEYTLRFTQNVDRKTLTKNIIVENCTWTDMGGIIFGATGAHYKTTSNITYKNCVFKRIGLDGGSHMIYNAYGSQHIRIIDSHFEDCKGDYIRFRANSDYGIVKGSTFIRNNKYPDRPFISSPLFNNEPTGDEVFPTNLSYTNNKFINNASGSTINAVTFYHTGSTPVQWNYLLTPIEGNVLQNGTVAERTNLLQVNFGIYPDKIRIDGNTFTENITDIVSLGTFAQWYGISKGFEGWGVITDLFKSNNQPFIWEGDL